MTSMFLMKTITTLWCFFENTVFCIIESYFEGIQGLIQPNLL